MSPGTTTPRADPIRIEIESCGVRAQKADRALHILNLRRKFVCWRQAVIDGGNQIAAFDECGNIRSAVAVLFVTSAPRTAVYIDYGGCGLGSRGLGKVYI